MGCDIHLFPEMREKKENAKWVPADGMRSRFSERTYGIFAAMAGVRDYFEKPIKIYDPRGMPSDMGYKSKEYFYHRVIDDDKYQEYMDDWDCSPYIRSTAEKWISKRYSDGIYSEDGVLTHCSNPDIHTPSWLNTQELRKCYNSVFCKDGEHAGDYARWLGLVGMLEAIESTGEYECRVVFGFDN